MSENSLRIYIITEGKAGHLSQSKGIASLTDGEKNIRIINFNLKKGTLESLFRTSVALNHKTGKPSIDYLWETAKKFIDGSEIELLEKDKPQLVISAGTIPASLNVILSRRFKCPNVVAMRPSVIPLDAFSLAVLPLHDVSTNPPKNVIALSTSPNECREELIADEKRIFAADNGLDMDIPFWGIFIGGESKARKFPRESVLKILRHVLDEAVRRNYQCLITTSRRTPPEFEETLGSIRMEYHNQIAYLQIYSNNPKSTTKGILGLSSHVFITEDSVSMASESLWAMRKTLLVELPSSKNTVDKIDRFKKNLIEKKLIRTIKSDMGSESISEAIDFKPDFESFTDINLVRDAVNRLIPI